MKFHDLIKEICEEEGIDLKILSGNYLLMLTKDNVQKYIWGHKFPLNSHSVGEILDDKYALYCVLNANNIPVIEHRILWNNHSKLGNDTDKLLVKYFKEFNNKAVIKPNNGSKGIGVSLVESLEDAQKVCQNLFIKNYSISITPFYEIENEYRVIVLDNKVELVYAKNKPVVIGNGTDTIKDLLIKLNPAYFQSKNLANYNKVLKKGEVFEYDWHFNLSKGATANFIKDKKLEEEVKELALKVTNCLGSNFVSVDIIKSHDKLYVMEVNSGVCINKVCSFIDQDFQIAKNIYHKAIKKMFEIN